MNIGQQIGIAVGCLVGLVIIILCGVYLERYVRRKRVEEGAQLYNDIQQQSGQTYDNPLTDSNFFALKERENERSRQNVTVSGDY